MTDQTERVMSELEQKYLNLWPAGQLPPKITVVSAEIGKGKSTFALTTGADMDRIACFDLEISQEGSAHQMEAQDRPYTYIDVSAALLKRMPGGHKSIDLYNFVTNSFKMIPAFRYDTIILDNASIFEDALVNYVENNPQVFGKTAEQYRRSSGLMWGDVKTLYQQILTDLASKTHQIIIVVHMANEYAGNQPAKDSFGKVIRKPKGKETLELLASLFVILGDPIKDHVEPSAKVLKCRVDRRTWVEDPENPPSWITKAETAGLYGEPGLVVQPILPRVIPVCTWPAIRQYMRHPADLINPKEEEKVTKVVMTDDDRLAMKLRTAELEAAAAEAKLQLVESPESTPAYTHESIPANPNKAKTKEDLMAYGKTFKLDGAGILAAMGAKGLKWDPDNYDKLAEAVKEWADSQYARTGTPAPDAA